MQTRMARKIVLFDATSSLRERYDTSGRICGSAPIIYSFFTLVATFQFWLPNPGMAVTQTVCLCTVAFGRMPASVAVRSAGLAMADENQVASLLVACGVLERLCGGDVRAGFR